MMAKKYSILTLVGVLVLSTFFTAFSFFTPQAPLGVLGESEGNSVHAASKKLTDIPARHAKEINYLIEQGIVEGYPDGTFKPNELVKRSEAAKILGKIKNLSSAQRTTSFKDVPKSHWASGYIESAKVAGYINGYPDGTYKPEKDISRVESSFIITKAFNLTEKVDLYFKDLPNDPLKNDVISKMIGSGIMSSIGYGDGTFKPDRAVTREEFAVMIARALNESFRLDPAEGQTKMYVATSTTPLNVRKGPGTSYGIIGQLPNNTEVIVHYYENNNWAFVTAGSIKGFVSTAYLTPDPNQQPAPNPTPDPNPVKRYIAIDAGHGGNDPGAIGNGVVEKELNLDVAKRVQQKLEQSGVRVFMTRTDDTFVSLEERVNRAIKAGVDTFVSIHANSFSNGSASGTETYYSTASLNPRAADSKKLAEFIQKRLVAALGTKDRGVKTANFVVIRNPAFPSALIELAFISNESDAKKLASNTYRDKAAEAIAQGILDYYNWKEK